MTILLSWVEFQGLQGNAGAAHGAAIGSAVSAAVKRSPFLAEGTSFCQFDNANQFRDVVIHGTSTVIGVGALGINPYTTIWIAADIEHETWTDADIDNETWTPAQSEPEIWTDHIRALGT